MDPQMLMAILSAMGSGMQAGAPSTNPASGNLMGVLGSALTGGAKGYMAGDEMRRSEEYMRMMQEAMQRKVREAEAKADPASIAEAMRMFDPRNQYAPWRPDDEPNGRPPSLASRMPRSAGNWWDDWANGYPGYEPTLYKRLGY